MRLQRICGHSFLQDLMSHSAVVLDCGANHGEFSRWISENCNAVVHGFEPDPSLFPKLPHLRSVQYHPVAISATGKPLKLCLGDARCSTACLPEHSDQKSIIVESIKLNEFCSNHEIGHIDLVKMDIEGAEIEVLKELPEDFLMNIGQITVEFHDFINKLDLPRIESILKKMQNIGFVSYKYSIRDHSDVLFINKRMYNLTQVDNILLCAIKYYNGFVRIAGRYLKKKI